MPILKFKKGIIHVGVIVFALVGLTVFASATILAKPDPNDPLRGIDREELRSRICQMFPWGRACGGASDSRTGAARDPNRRKPGPCFPMGSVNHDSYVDKGDASIIKKYVKGTYSKSPIKPEYLANADVNADGSITDADAQLIIQYVEGTVTTFPACNNGETNQGTTSPTTPSTNPPSGGQPGQGTQAQSEYTYKGRACNSDAVRTWLAAMSAKRGRELNFGDTSTKYAGINWNEKSFGGLFEDERRGITTACQGAQVLFAPTAPAYPAARGGVQVFPGVYQTAPTTIMSVGSVYPNLRTMAGAWSEFYAQDNSAFGAVIYSREAIAHVLRDVQQNRSGPNGSTVAAIGQAAAAINDTYSSHSLLPDWVVCWGGKQWAPPDYVRPGYWRDPHDDLINGTPCSLPQAVRDWGRNSKQIFAPIAL